LSILNSACSLQPRSRADLRYPARRWAPTLITSCCPLHPAHHAQSVPCGFRGCSRPWPFGRGPGPAGVTAASFAAERRYRSRREGKTIFMVNPGCTTASAIRRPYTRARSAYAHRRRWKTEACCRTRPRNSRLQRQRRAYLGLTETNDGRTSVIRAGIREDGSAIPARKTPPWSRCAAASPFPMCSGRPPPDGTLPGSRSTPNRCFAQAVRCLRRVTSFTDITSAGRQSGISGSEERYRSLYENSWTDPFEPRRTAGSRRQPGGMCDPRTSEEESGRTGSRDLLDRQPATPRLEERARTGLPRELTFCAEGSPFL